MAAPTISADERRRINPHISLVPSLLGAGVDNILPFPGALEERLIPSFLKHLVQRNKSIAEIGFYRMEREAYTPQLDLFQSMPVPDTAYERRTGYIKDDEGKEYAFNLVPADKVEGQPAAFSGIRMHDDAWLIALYDDVMSYRIQ